MPVNPYDVTQLRTGWPYRAVIFPNYGWKHKEGSTWFSVFCLLYDVFDVMTWEPITVQHCESEGVHPVVPGLLWFPAQTQNHIQLKPEWTPLSFFNPNLEKQQPYMVNLCLIMWRQQDSTCIPSSHHLCYVFWVKYLTANNIQQLTLLEIEHLIFFHLMLVLVGQIFIV